ncbi:phage tail protein [Kutzneria sp. CA-103260]|uniref:phage tail protein n=1 Tax=Kutzneria sp. CA-103260 TaxID=2802641 RepID=UPI001BA5F97E|nr:phage tail protein [Kutzneria sp. CA-103260]
MAVGTDLRLATTPSGPLGLAAEDGSLGGLVLPTGFALSADDILYLLDPNGVVVRRFDPRRQEFVAVLGDAPAHDVTALGEVVNIAITGRLLYVADRRHRRVLVYGLPQLNLTYVWHRDWDLADVRSDGTATYLLDRKHGAVWRHCPHEDEPQLVLTNAELAGQATKVSVDTSGLIYLYAPEVLHRSDGAEFTDPGQLRSRFVAPALRLVSGVFVLPEGLTLQCGRHAEPDREGDVAEPASVAPTGPAFDRTGQPVPPPRASRGPVPYVKTGEWTSAVLDSRIYRCVWDRVRLDLSALPAGTSVEAETTTSDDPTPADWTSLGSETGQAHAPGTPPEAEVVDWPVRSRPGRYLTVRLRLSGPGRATPMVSALRVHYPRSSYLEFLPAIYGADQDSKDFLERFLGSMQVEWDGLAARIADLPAFADPKAVPAGAALRFLAGWLGVPLDQRWTADQQRSWLLASLSVLRRRGTPEALRAMLSALMAILTGIDPSAVGLPALVEGFRTRDRLELGQPDNAPAPLWSPDVVARLRLGSYARVGQARLVSTGDPAHDFFTTTADSFRVYLPSSWVRTAEDERAVHRLLTAERPATSQYQLCLVEPRLRVAAQATVGLDTVVGAVPSARLACRHDDTTPPSRPPRHRLGLDTVLASAQPHRPVRVGPGTRIGAGTGIR